MVAELSLFPHCGGSPACSRLKMTSVGISDRRDMSGSPGIWITLVLLEPGV